MLSHTELRPRAQKSGNHCDRQIILRSAVLRGGEVGRPGLVEPAPGMTALQAVFNAGGFLDTAKLEAVLVIRNGTADAPITNLT